MRFERERVLRFTRDLVFARDVLGGHAHMDRLERVVQRADHHVDEARVAHALTEARGRHGVRRAAHVFRAAADRDVGVAEQHALRGRHDRLQARAAQTVHGQCRRMLRDAAVDRGHARQVHVFRLGMHDVAEHHVADFVARYAGARQHFTHHACAELGRRKIFQTAAETADCRTHTAYHHYVPLHRSLLFSLSR